MNRRAVITTAITLMCVGFTFSANAQSLKQQVVGAWTLTSGTEKLPDGKVVTPWAAGNLLLDAGGHFSFFVVGKDRPKGDANPRVPIGPFVAYYGTYTVDEGAKTVTYTIDSASAPAFDKMVRAQAVSLSGDTMTTTGTPVKTPQGDIVPVNEWKRAK
jgi:hypothetical protein